MQPADQSAGCIYGHFPNHVRQHSPVRDYRRAHNMPSYAEAKGIAKKEPKTAGELMNKIKELEKALKNW